MQNGPEELSPGRLQVSHSYCSLVSVDPEQIGERILDSRLECGLLGL
jgi:hypothetical protein